MKIYIRGIDEIPTGVPENFILNRTESVDGCLSPHCDAKVLHIPGSCKYCDLFPEAQKERVAKKICFTNEAPTPGKYPCPAIRERGSACQIWGGNVPKKD